MSGQLIAIANVITSTILSGRGYLPIVVEFEARVIADGGCVREATMR